MSSDEETVAAETGVETSHSPSDSPSSTSISEYEARRREQILRNQQMLVELTGVATAATSRTPARLQADSVRSAERASKAREEREKRKRQREEQWAMVPRRDLPPRRAKQRDITYQEDNIAVIGTSSSHHSNGVERRRSDVAKDEEDTTPRPNAKLSDFNTDPFAIPPGVTSSCKGSMTQSLHTLSSYLGQTIPLTYNSPKASAMSFLIYGWPSEDNTASHRLPPTFNRISGIQPLANHIALFINCDPNNEYTGQGTMGSHGHGAYGEGNQWLDGGRKISWFAQPSQRVDTPIIGRIVSATMQAKRRMDGTHGKDEEAYATKVLQGASHAIKQEDAAASDSPPPSSSPSKRAKRSTARDGVAAVTPLDQDVTVKHESGKHHNVAAAASSSSSSVSHIPSRSSSSSSSSSLSLSQPDPFSVVLFIRHEGAEYIYCGELAYHSHDTTRIPMKFIFTLTRYDTLKHCADFWDKIPKHAADPQDSNPNNWKKAK